MSSVREDDGQLYRCSQILLEFSIVYEMRISARGSREEIGSVATRSPIRQVALTLRYPPQLIFGFNFY